MPRLRQSRVTLYQYQREAVALIDKRNGCAGLFMEMGTGKTLVALSYLAKTHARRILIVCPLSVIGVWRAEIRKTGLPWEILTLERGSVEKAAQQLCRFSGGSVECVIVNYDAYWRYPAGNKRVKNREMDTVEIMRMKERGLRRAIRNWQPDAIVMDEAQRLKGRMTKQARFAHELQALPSVKTRLALTGTPIMNGIEDLFSLYRFIDPSIFGTSYPEFERRHIVKGGYGGYQIVGYRQESEVREKVGATSYQISRAEALELPERTTTIVPITLGPKARAIYERMKRDAIVELELPGPDGLPLRGRALASIVLTTLIRLQQIAGGSLPLVTEQGETKIADIGSEKLDIAIDLVTNAIASGQKVVIFCKFIHDLDRLKGAFKHHFRAEGQGKHCIYCGHLSKSSIHLSPTVESRFAVISGDVPVDQRDRNIQALRRGDLDVLGVQIQTGSLGIDLTAASVAIFYSTGYSLGEFLQARDRLHRHGQTRKVSEYLLQVEDSIDEQIWAALLAKQQIARKVTSLDYAKGLIRGKASTR